MARPLRAVLFDYGNVLVPWDPRTLYRKIFNVRSYMDDFLERVCTLEWNAEMDRGALFRPAIARLIFEHPHRAGAIRAWLDRFGEMNEGEIPGMAALVAELQTTPLKLGVLSNMSAETRKACLAHFPAVDAFHAIVISGEEKICKPEPAIYAIAAAGLDVAPDEILFVDDSQINVDGASAAGMRAHRFAGADDLRSRLTAEGAFSTV